MVDLLPVLLRWGWPVILLTLLSSGLGSPIPEDIPLLAAGVLSAHGGTSAPVASVVLVIFVLLRDFAVFQLGRRFGPRLEEHAWLRRVVPRRLIRRVEPWVLERGAWVVAAGRFLPGLRVAVFFTAGLAQVPARTFLIVDAVAAALSVPLFVFVGAAVGRRLDALSAVHDQLRVVLLGALLIVIGSFLATRLKRGVKTLTPAP